MENFTFSEEQVQEILSEAKRQVLGQLKIDLVENVQYAVKRGMGDAIKDEISAFVVEEVVPMVREHLKENKDTILSQTVKLVEDVSVAIAQALTAKVIDNLTEHSYKRDKILKSLLD